MFVPITLNLSQLVGDVSLTSVARGDLLMRGASKWGNLAPGTSGKYLQSAGAGSDLAWASISGADVLSALGYVPGTVTSVAGSGGSTGLTLSGGPITASGTLTLGGTLAIGSGGTGQATAAAAFNALSPMTTAGDLIYGGVSGAGTRLAIGTNGYVMTVSGGAPTWSAQSVIDHGSLGGLTDDDHTQYALLAPATDARNVIQPAAADVKALVLKGAASQSDNLLELQNSSGTSLGSFSATGLQTINPTTLGSSSYGLKILPNDTTDFWGVQNGTGSAGKFYPTFVGSTTGSTSYPLAFLGIVANDAAGDTSEAQPALYFDGRRSSSALVTRSLMEVGNYAVTRWRLLATGAVKQFVLDTATNSVTTCLTLGHNTTGSPAAGLGSGLVFAIESSTTENTTAGKVTGRWGVATHASREGITAIIATDFNGDRTGFEVTGDGTNTEIGFYGVTPVARPSAYTQTYSTADKTHANPTAATLTVTDGAGTNDGTIGAITADASVIAAVQELADQINKLVADMADIKQVVNSVIDDLQGLGLLQ